MERWVRTAAVVFLGVVVLAAGAAGVWAVFFSGLRLDEAYYRAFDAAVGEIGAAELPPSLDLSVVRERRRIERVFLRMPAEERSARAFAIGLWSASLLGGHRGDPAEIRPYLEELRRQAADPGVLGRGDDALDLRLYDEFSAAADGLLLALTAARYPEEETREAARRRLESPG